jgi:hypothetical protein
MPPKGIHPEDDLDLTRRRKSRARCELSLFASALAGRPTEAALKTSPTKSSNDAPGVYHPVWCRDRRLPARRSGANNRKRCWRIAFKNETDKTSRDRNANPYRLVLLPLHPSASVPSKLSIPVFKNGNNVVPISAILMRPSAALAISDGGMLSTRLEDDPEGDQQPRGQQRCW